MVQSFNFNAIQTTFKTLLKPQLLIPHKIVEDFNKINWIELKNKGFKKVILDKDNCITIPYEDELFYEFKNNWNTLLNTFGNNNIFILSNSAGALSDDPNGLEAKRLSKCLDIKVLEHEEKKPIIESKLLQKLLQFNNNQLIQPYEIIMVGDRLTTDILGGNLNGFYTILTQRILSLSKDNFMAVKMRNLERSYLNGLFTLGYKPTNHPLD